MLVTLATRNNARLRSSPTQGWARFYLFSERLPYGRLWFHKVEDAVDYGKCYSRSHGAIIRVFDQSGAVVETHEYAAGRES